MTVKDAKERLKQVLNQLDTFAEEDTFACGVYDNCGGYYETTMQDWSIVQRYEDAKVFLTIE